MKVSCENLYNFRIIEICTILSIKENHNLEITFRTLKSGNLRVRREEGPNQTSLVSMDFPAIVPQTISNFKIRFALTVFESGRMRYSD